MLAFSSRDVRHLNGVVVADHVVRKNNVALAREGDAPPGNRRYVRVFEPSIRPVPVGRNQRGERPAAAKRAVKIAPQIKTWHSFEENFFDGVALALDASKNLDAKGLLLGHRQKSRRELDLLAQMSRARLPFGARFEHRRRKMSVQGNHGHVP